MINFSLNLVMLLKQVHWEKMIEELLSCRKTEKLLLFHQNCMKIILHFF
nr:MAG TPA: hypothetical protein [Caudoviricetes sp.]